MLIQVWTSVVFPSLGVVGSACIDGHLQCDLPNLQQYALFPFRTSLSHTTSYKLLDVFIMDIVVLFCSIVIMISDLLMTFDMNRSSASTSPTSTFVHSFDLHRPTLMELALQSYTI